MDPVRKHQVIISVKYREAQFANLLTPSCVVATDWPQQVTGFTHSFRTDR